MDLCLRSSIPLLLLALALLGIAYPRTTGKSSANGNMFLSGNNNATETIIDYTRNDLLLGSHDPFFCMLVPVFGLISVGICVALNYLMLIATHVLATATSFISKLIWRNHPDRSNAPASLAVTPIKRRIVMTGVLLLLVSTVIPYQFVFIVLCVVQLATCVRALNLARETYLATNLYFHNYAHSILMLMLWILPINLPTLVVWVHNIAVHWLTPFSSHHNILSIAPYVVLVEMLSTGRMIPQLPSWLRHATSFFLFGLAVFAAMYGVTYAYLLHHGVNILCLWLIGLHVSATGLQFDKLSGWLRGNSLTGHSAHAGTGATDRKDARKKQP